MRAIDALIGDLGRAGRIRSDERGASAVEFALLAPILVLACLATLDLGVAISQKMEIDHALRAGSEGAMRDLGEDDVEQLVKDIAAQSFTIADEGDISSGGLPLSVTVDRFCACPESPSTSFECGSGTCAASADPYEYYRLSAEKDYDTFYMPAFQLSGSLLVQVE